MPIIGGEVVIFRPRGAVFDFVADERHEPADAVTARQDSVRRKRVAVVQRLRRDRLADLIADALSQQG